MRRHKPGLAEPRARGVTDFFIVDPQGYPRLCYILYKEDYRLQGLVSGISTAKSSLITRLFLNSSMLVVYARGGYAPSPDDSESKSPLPEKGEAHHDQNESRQHRRAEENLGLLHIAAL
jgi:hypothetical protein